VPEVFFDIAKPLKVSSKVTIFASNLKSLGKSSAWKSCGMHPGLLPCGSVNWQYREQAMASTRVKCLNQCTVSSWPLKQDGLCNRVATCGGLTVVSVFWSDSEKLYSHFTLLPQVRKWSGEKKFFKVREGSGNFILSQGKLTK